MNVTGAYKEMRKRKERQRGVNRRREILRDGEKRRKCLKQEK